MPKRPRTPAGAFRSPEPAQRAQDRSLLCGIALAGVLVLLALLSLRQVGSLDAGFHLAVGNSILDGQGWPRFDRFTYTLADHRYVDTSWGYQVLLASAERAGGAAAIVLLHSALLLLAFASILLAVTHGRADPRVLVTLLLLGVLAAELRYQARPELLSYAMLALLLALLHRRAERGSGPLWPIAPLFLVWANCHSLFVLGWVVLGCFTAGITLRERRLDRRLAGWSAIAVVVTLVNPYGWRALVFPFTLATRLDRDNPFATAIGEFESPFDLTSNPALPFAPDVPLWGFRIFFGLTVLSLPLLLRQRRYAAALLALPFLFLSAKMVRNMPLLVVACLPGTVWACGGWVFAGRTRALTRALAAASLVVSAVLGLRVVTDAHYIASRRVDRFGLTWNGLAEPLAAAAWLERAGLPGRMLNHLNFGGYLMWALDDPVFIDGRLEVVGEEFFEGVYRRALSSAETLERAVAQWGIGWVAFPYATNRSLLQVLSDDPRWRLVYFDHLAAVFARSDLVGADAVEPATREALLVAPGLPDLERLPGVDAPRPSPAEVYLAGLLRRQRFPADDHNRGLFHYYRRDARRAAVHFADAIRASGGAYWELYQNLGASLRRLDLLQEALACYRVVSAAAPADAAIAERVRELEAAAASTGTPRAP